MNHQRVYDCLVAHAVSQDRPRKGNERHHIVPRCLGGGDEKSNIVVMTYREHYLAHQLLARIHGGRLWYAAIAFRMKGRNGNSRSFEHARKQAAAWKSAHLKGVPQSPELRAKRAKAMIGNTNTLGKKMSAESSAKKSKAMLGNKHTLGFIPGAETRKKMSAIHAGEKHHYFGKKRSEEVKQKIRAALLGKPQGPRAPHDAEARARISASVRAAYQRKRESTLQLSLQL